MARTVCPLTLVSGAMSKVRDWLHSLGLGNYAQAFEDNAYDRIAREFVRLEKLGADPLAVTPEPIVA